LNLSIVLQASIWSCPLGAGTDGATHGKHAYPVRQAGWTKLQGLFIIS
jgi:hypothetical protein